MGKRMYAHDYTRPGFYMITILTAGRRRLFGRCENNRTRLSEMGEIVKRRWHEIPQYRPGIETNTLVVMPDHLHGIVYVKGKLPKPVGQTIRGYKSGATSELRKHTNDPRLDIWEEGYHDRVIMNSDTLRSERRYIADNPRRYCVRKDNPELFVRVNRLEHPRLPAGPAWAGYGNLHLIGKPAMMPVQVSRKASQSELAALKAHVKKQSWRGTVVVSPFISPGEKEIAQEVMAQDYGSLILVKPEGFPPLYKPSGVYFDLCAQGRLLVLSPYPHTGRAQPLTRERCLEMNEYVEEMCGGMCGNNAAPR
ncbi:MAG: transposase [Kiritimatiellia bacterium]